MAVLCGGLFCFLFLERESNYQFVHSAWQISMAVAILFLLPQSPVGKDDKYSMLDTRPAPYTAVESSFKHYPEADGGPTEIINVTSSAGGGGGGGAGTILPPDQVIDVSRAPSLATLNGAGVGVGAVTTAAGTLPRASTLSSRSHHGGGGTLKRHSQFQSDQSRNTGAGAMPYEPG